MTFELRGRSHLPGRWASPLDLMRKPGEEAGTAGRAKTPKPHGLGLSSAAQRLCEHGKLIDLSWAQLFCFTNMQSF